MGARAAMRRLAAAVIRIATAVFLTVGLFLSYFLGMGLARLLASVFARRLLSAPRGISGTAWVDAEGYDGDREDCLRPS